jgi:RHS repeat-associated protein
MRQVASETMLDQSLRDFAGDERHEDYTLANVGGQPVATPRRVYLGGIGHVDYHAGEGHYTHSDFVGSKVLSTAVGPVPEIASPTARAFFTAFGQEVAADAIGAARSRYGFAGAWGYEGRDPTVEATFDVLADAGLLHVGARHLDTSSGRFLERDPKGIAGGLNVFVYARNRPTTCVDPTGLSSFFTAILDGVETANSVRQMCEHIKNRDWRNLTESIIEWIASEALDYVYPPAGAGYELGRRAVDAGLYVHDQAMKLWENFLAKPTPVKPMSLTEDGHMIDRLADDAATRGVGRTRGLRPAN